MKKILLILFILVFWLISITPAAQVGGQMGLSMPGVMQDGGFIGIRFFRSSGSAPDPYADYNLYVDFTDSITDKVSGEDMATVLSAGRPLLVNDVYTEFGENEPTINEDGLHTYGAFTCLNGKTNDVSDSYWNKTVTVINYNTIQATAQYQKIERVITTTDSTLYTLSFYAHVEAGGNTSNYIFRHGSSGDGNSSTLTLTETRKRYCKTVLGRPGGGSVYFGLADWNTSNWAKIYIDTINITETGYLLPEIQNDTTSSVTIPLNYSDADEGNKYPINGTDTPKLLLSLYGTDGTDAQGEFEIEWTPMFDVAEVSGQINIITANDEFDTFLYYDADTSQIKASDGTNTAVASLTAVSGTKYKINLKYGIISGTQMQIGVDDSYGTAVTFVGSFPLSTHMSIGWGSDDWQVVKLIKGFKEIQP